MDLEENQRRLGPRLERGEATRWSYPNSEQSKSNLRNRKRRESGTGEATMDGRTQGDRMMIRERSGPSTRRQSRWGATRASRMRSGRADIGQKPRLARRTIATTFFKERRPILFNSAQQMRHPPAKIFLNDKQEHWCRATDKLKRAQRQ